MLLSSTGCYSLTAMSLRILKTFKCENRISKLTSIASITEFSTDTMLPLHHNFVESAIFETTKFSILGYLLDENRNSF